MTTDAQLDNYDEEQPVHPQLKGAAKQAITMAGSFGATADEAYALAYPHRAYEHGIVDSFRVAIRHLRVEGVVADSGRKRVSIYSGKAQTVWVLGDDRDVVARDQRLKLTKFATQWLLDELAARGVDPPLDLGAPGFCVPCGERREHVVGEACLDCKVHYGTASTGQREAYRYGQAQYRRGFENGKLQAQEETRLF